MPGDAAYMGLLPWLVDSYAAAIRHLPPAPSGSADRGVRLVGSLLESLRCCMEAASSGGDAASWSTAVTASATVLRAAHRCELLGAGAGVQEALSSHLALVMGQFEQLNAPEAGGACCHLFSSLSGVDVRVLEAHVQDVWHALWLGHRHDARGAESAACDLISAYGDVRQVLPLLRAFTDAAASPHAAQHGAHLAELSCAASVTAAWSAAAAMLPASRVPEALASVGECLACALNANVLGSTAAQAAERLPSLVDALVSLVAGLAVTSTTAPAAGEAAAALQTQIGSLHASLDASGSAASQASAACLVRVSLAVCSLAHFCCDSAGCSEEAEAAVACVAKCDALLDSATTGFLKRKQQHRSAWLHYELARAAVLRTAWAARGADEPRHRAAVAQLQQLVVVDRLRPEGSVLSWDGALSSLDTTRLPCAFVQLLTESASIWCASFQPHLRASGTDLCPSPGCRLWTRRTVPPF